MNGYRRLSVLLLALAFAASPLLSAATRTGKTRRTATHIASSTRHRRHSSSKAAKRTRKPRKPNAYQRLAKMQMDPDRVESIQKALGDAGVYHGTPSGHWDSETRDAMARYQTQNGFGVTGLPDAKSLMKLGLGPHPLPAELDKTRAADLDPNPAVNANPAPPDSTPLGTASPAPSDGATPGSPAPPEHRSTPVELFWELSLQPPAWLKLQANQVDAV
jgi:peptidoglycan hydrolase-like protein with peptidoglycan-binding domain